ncbi:Fe-S cluster assembly protein SufD [Xanthomonas citri pv. glycines]|uniref:Fe-S cluster assembly protein SufD n=1 Tax=Xanthomonas campestris pv. glycines TaxID=473421 RepID=A0AAX0I026_XANCG|nr:MULTISPECIES: Fe-S cluster assembly protein SufD [Xanthomonas]AOY62301.1 Fe-S cluster assembly protein SufD [Xanthomonas citri pv. glycines str. 8ra]ARV24008.1 Fe-S cluster assembly protein SufD [Xanthomonas citri pv. glycines str. 12-2]EWC51854.1 ABC transporter permease [Xanthomonas citri pv. glycines str. 8ra]OEY90096.1 Fe-S cluster assembly protein SufD [Xanthomonas citri pv. glycines]OOX02602.1 ABC transporter permease [Xanthomonas citri pv. glycines]
MSALLDSLARGFSGSDARRAELDAALQTGLPGPRAEAWKYTSLRQLERRSFQPAPLVPTLVDAAALDDIPSPRLVLVNGRPSEALSDLSTLPEGVQLDTLSASLAASDQAQQLLGRRFDGSDEVFARLNAALADEGVLVRVHAGARIELPLHLVFVGVAGEQDLSWHHRHLIELRAGAALQVIEHHLHVGDAAHLENSVMHVHLAQGAALSHARVQAGSAHATSLLRTDAVLARDARYQRVDLELGAGLSRHEFNVRLEGNNAQLTANGVLLGNGRRHVDTRLGIEHIARDTACELVWRGVGADRSRVVFHGGIRIRAGADGTDARLSNKNLLLSSNAEIDTQPVLVIDADEVQAAHGATVGQLDDNALFYLRSRGLPQEQAQRLLSAAFCHEPLRVLPPALSAVLALQLDRALNSAGVA